MRLFFSKEDSRFFLSIATSSERLTVVKVSSGTDEWYKASHQKNHICGNLSLSCRLSNANSQGRNQPENLSDDIEINPVAFLLVTLSSVFHTPLPLIDHGSNKTLDCPHIGHIQLLKKTLRSSHCHGVSYVFFTLKADRVLSWGEKKGLFASY